VGDWDGDGDDDPGVVVSDANRDGVTDPLLTWLLDTDGDQFADIPPIQFGLPGVDVPVAGQWNFPEVSVTQGDTVLYTGQTRGIGPDGLIFTLRNDGTTTLTVGAPSVPRGFIIEGFGGPLFIAPSATHNFTVRVDPTVNGKQSGALSFSTNDGNENPFRVGLTELAPEIAVYQGSTPIGDGGSFDFGGALSKEFSIRNVGGLPLLVEAPVLENQGIFKFSTITTFPATVAPGASIKFTLTVDDAFAGLHAGHISFGNTDSAASPFNFSLRARVASLPEIAVYDPDGREMFDGSSSYRFPTVNTGTALEKSFRIENRGERPLTVQAPAITDARFTIVSGAFPITINGGSAHALTVRVDTSTAMTATSDVIIANNDDPNDGDDENPFSFSMQATVNVIPAEIEVRDWENKVVSDGGASDLGLVEQGDAVHRQYTILNLGNAPLRVEEPTISNTSFILVRGRQPQFPTTIAGNSSLTFSVSVNSSTEGQKLAVAVHSVRSSEGAERTGRWSG